MAQDHPLGTAPLPAGARHEKTSQGLVSAICHSGTPSFCGRPSKARAQAARRHSCAAVFTACLWGRQCPRMGAEKTASNSTAHPYVCVLHVDKMLPVGSDKTLQVGADACVQQLQQADSSPASLSGLQAKAAKQDLERLLSNSRFDEIQRIQKAAAEEVAAAQKQLQEVGDEARTRAAAEIDVMRAQTAATLQEARWG